MAAGASEPGIDVRVPPSPTPDRKKSINCPAILVRVSRLVGLALVAALIAAAPPSPASTAGRPAHRGHRHAKRHPRHLKDPAGGFVLRGLGSEIVPSVGVGDISLPSPVLPAEILHRFGRPGPTAGYSLTIGRLNGAIVSIAYFSDDSRAGIAFRFDGPPVNSLDGIGVGSPAYHTPQGLHVGSTGGEVQAALPQAQCDEYACSVFARAANGTVSVTAFDLLGGKVVQIDVTGERSGDPY